jgi:Ca2+-binding EF-hand superfamily protein
MQGQKPILSTMSLRHAGSLKVEDNNDEDFGPFPKVWHRGMMLAGPTLNRQSTSTFPSSRLSETPATSRPTLNRQATNITVQSRVSDNTGSKTTGSKSHATRGSPLISLRSPGGEMSFHEEPSSEKTGFRHWVKEFVMSQNFEMFAGIAILSNFIVIILETNARATMSEEERDSEGFKRASQTLALCGKINLVFLSFYAAECLTRLFALRKGFFHSKWNIFDMSIVIVGLGGELLEIAFGSLADSNMEVLQVLRNLRMLRLLRAARVIISFKELYALIIGMSGCLRTLVWAAALLFLMLTMWSIVAVEYLHGYVADLTRQGFYDDCKYCSLSFSNIMYANLTFFQIVSGDGWTELATPLIMNHPWTAIIFVGVIFSMVFGMLNLVTAVIVDTAVQARESDVMHMAAQKEHERRIAWRNFASLCIGMDLDEDGRITLEELRRGTEEILELNAQLSAMGVEWHDLQMVFEMFDDKQIGKIPINEFVNHLYKMQTHEHKTTHVFVKHYVEDIRKHVICLRKMSEEWSRQSSKDFAKEPEVEPKSAQSEPRIPPSSIVDGIESPTESSQFALGLPSIALPVPPVYAVGDDKLDSGVKLPRMKPSSPDELESRAQKLCKSPSPQPQITIQPSISEDDLEIGQCIEIDNAVDQYYRGGLDHGFPVLRTMPCNDRAQQNVPASHGCPMPTLLDSHHRWSSDRSRSAKSD